MAKEIELSGTAYRVNRIDVFKQFHLVRKIMPMVVGMMAVSDPAKRKDPVLAFGPVAEMLARMSTEDSEYVLGVCLSAVEKKIGEHQWAPVKAAGANVLMDGTMPLTTVLQVVQAVVQENLGDFFTVVAQLYLELGDKKE